MEVLRSEADLEPVCLPGQVGVPDNNTLDHSQLRNRDSGMKKRKYKEEAKGEESAADKG